MSDALLVRDDTTLKNDDTIREGDRLGNVVRHQHCGEPLAQSHLLEQLLHLEPGQCIKGAEGLIKKKQLRLRDQRPRQCNALALTAGKDARPFIVAAIKSNRLQGGQRRDAPFSLEAGTDILEDAAPRQQARFLKEKARVGDLPRIHSAIDGNHPHRRDIESCDETKQRALAATAMADNRQKFAGGNGEGNIAQDVSIAKALGEGCNLDRNAGVDTAW